MLTQNYAKASHSQSKFFKFQIKRIKSPLHADEKLNYQKETLSLKRIKSAGKYKKKNQQNHSNITSQTIEKQEIFSKKHEEIQSKSLQNMFQKLKQKHERNNLNENCTKACDAQKQKYLQFSQKIKLKNGSKYHLNSKQISSLKLTDYKPNQKSLSFIKGQQKQKTISIISEYQIKQQKKKSHPKQDNNRFVDQYQLFSKISLQNSNQNSKMVTQVGTNETTTDSANGSHSLQRFHKLQKQLLKKNELIKILQRRCAQNNLEGLKKLERSKSITQKIKQKDQMMQNIKSTISHNNSIKNTQNQNQEFQNRVYFLQKKCEMMQKNNNNIKNQLQIKQKHVRELQQKMLKVYQQNLKYLNQLELTKKQIALFQVSQSQLLKKNLDLEISLEIIKQEKQKYAIQQKKQRRFQIFKELEEIFNPQTQKKLNIFIDQNQEEDNILDLSRQLIKEVEKIQNQEKYFSKQPSRSIENVCLLQTRQELPNQNLYSKFYQQIGNIFGVALNSDLHEYHDQILYQIQEFKNTIAELIKTIKNLTKKVQQNQQKQKNFKDQIRILKCKTQKMIEENEKNEYLMKNYKSIIQESNHQILRQKSEKMNQKYRQRFLQGY